ncbi:hypothetical protein [Pseudomonas sp. HS-18]|uniref:glycine-rich domain-containing protein n=1 Tax=Pseudomonas sp. HS-18 TaxID=2879114 RepID=UPI0021F0A573|nr:hypothetical protein [Pseudomonas sp. HS-18]
MQASNAPGKIQKPFADNGDKQAIPVASQIGVADGRASYTDGFPPLTRTPIVAGGVPPFGTDMNGVLNAITAILQWQSAGGTFKFDAAFATAIGGYPKGANLQKADGSGTWLCTVENNTANPDTGGAGWQDFSAGRLIGVQNFAASGSYTYTPTAGTKSVVVEVQGAGGSGGGTAATSAGQAAIGGGGGAGAYAKGRFTSGFSGVTITVGLGGAQTAAGNNNGNAGGTSSFGSLITAAGGGGGQGGGAGSSFPFASGGGSGAGNPTGGIINIGGANGIQPIALAANVVIASYGAPSTIGKGGLAFPTSGNGGPGLSGAGGGGACAGGVQPAFFGGNGGSGQVTIWEYA